MRWQCTTCGEEIEGTPETIGTHRCVQEQIDRMKALPIRVSELIAALQALPQDAFVFTEGCDCVGACSGVTFPSEHAPHTVLLERDDFRRWPTKEDAPAEPPPPARAPLEVHQADEPETCGRCGLPGRCPGPDLCGNV